MVGWFIWAALALVAPAYFMIGDELVRQVNQDVGASDQLANIWLARDAAGDWYPHRSSYIQPLWPWVSGWVADADDTAYFVNGKRLNLILGFGLMVVLFVVGAAALAPVPGYVLGLLGGMGVLLQRAHFFHPEPLLYGFFAASCVLMALTFFRNRWSFYAGWGICFGLAYLAKASVGLLLEVYLGATAVLWLAQAGVLPRWLSGPGDAGEWSLGRHAAGTLIGVLLAGAIMAPNLAFKYRVHGDPFFSPAKYWMWCDDWDTEAYPLYEPLWTAQSRAAFPPGKLPTAGNYLRKHGWAHVGKRLGYGLHVMAERFLVPPRKVPTALFWQMQGGASARGEPEKVWRYTLPARGLYLVLAGGHGCFSVGRPSPLGGSATFPATGRLGGNRFCGGAPARLLAGFRLVCGDRQGGTIQPHVVSAVADRFARGRMVAGADGGTTRGGDLRGDPLDRVDPCSGADRADSLCAAVRPVARGA